MQNNTLSLYRAAALSRGRTIGLYGGSFNPAHEGHLYIAEEALKQLKLDEVWFLVSPQNPLKSEDGMAPFEHRLKSADSFTRQNPRLRTLDIEEHIGSQYSAITIATLKKAMPFTRFVWMMGADNLKTFNRWKHWQLIAEMVPIAVFDRSGYALGGCAGEFARTFAKNRVQASALKHSPAPAWSLVTIPRHPASATIIRSQRGNNWFVDA